MKVSKKGRVLIPLAIMAALLVPASVAWACTYYNGQTYIDGSMSGSKARGASMTLTGNGVTTGSTPRPQNGDEFWAVMSPAGTCCNTWDFKLKEDIFLNTANNPDLSAGSVTVPTGANRRSDYWICLLDVTGGGDATAHAVLSVL